MRLSRTSVLAVLAAGTTAIAIGATAAASTPNQPAHRQGHWHHGGHRHHGAGRVFDHIYVIMLENHSQSSVIDDPNAPYITSLAHTYSMADNYYGVTNPSMPNYIASIAGDNFGLQDDNDQNVVNLDRPNIVDQLEAHHIGWDAYMQDLPANKLDRFGPTVDGTQVSARRSGRAVRRARRAHCDHDRVADLRAGADGAHPCRTRLRGVRDHAPRPTPPHHRDADVAAAAPQRRRLVASRVR